MNLNLRPLILVAALVAVCWMAPPAVHAQDAGSRSQAEVASKSVKFSPVNRAAREYKEANAATDLQGSKKLLGKPATFKGTVIEVLASDVVLLSFAEDSKSAVTVVVRQENFTRFPRLEELKGKEVVFTGKAVEAEGRTEVTLTRPGQLKIVQ
jgi:hypothetical protein